MNDPVINSLQDTLLFMLPSIGILLVNLFRLDEVFAAPRRSNSPHRPMCGVDAQGEPILCDPDGRRVPLPARRPRRLANQPRLLHP